MTLLRDISVHFLVVISCTLLSSLAFHNRLIFDRRCPHPSIHSRHKVVMLEHNSFRELFSTSIPPWLLTKCESIGFISPTLVQERVLPALFDGKDVVLQAQTGSGKTLAFALPLLSKIDPKRAAVQAIVVVPTRELGLQVASLLRQLASASPEKILVMTLVDGSKNRRQQLWAVAEPPHVVVGNPRSLERLIETGRLKLGATGMLVLDEVDACLIDADTRREVHTLMSRRLSSTFQSDNEEGTKTGPGMVENAVFRDLAKDHRDISSGEQYNIRRQTIMCSATIPQRQHFAMQCKQNSWTDTVPELIHVSPGDLMPTQLRHEYVEAEAGMQAHLVRYLVRRELEAWVTKNKKESAPGTTQEESAVDEFGCFQMLIFVDDVSRRGEESAERVLEAVQQGLQQAAARLSDEPAEAAWRTVLDNVSFLSEDLNLDTRADAVAAMRNGASAVLVSTDVAARGLDLPSVSVVLQVSLPDKMENYLHRAGRTGRLGRSGKVITLVSKEELFVVQRYSNELGIPIVKRMLKTKATDGKR